MPLIEWDESFSVDNSEIDEQHKKWFSIMNELHESLMKSDVQGLRETCANALKSMREYTRYHFSSEEEYMRKINYPGLAEHKKIHGQFYVQIMGYDSNIQTEKVLLTTEIMKVLKTWLQDHILSEDKKYSLFAHGK